MSYGVEDGNLIVEADGLYIVVLDVAAETVTLKETEHTWSVIGSICGTAWDTDFAMTEAEEGIFKSEALELKAGDELKVRQDGDWAVSYGVDGGNLVVEEDGSFIVVFDLNAETITLEKAE